MYIVHETQTDSTTAAVPGGMLRRVGATLAAWRAARMERRCLLEMDSHMLADIGQPRPVPGLVAVRLDRAE